MAKNLSHEIHPSYRIEKKMQPLSLLKTFTAVLLIIEAIGYHKHHVFRIWPLAAIAALTLLYFFLPKIFQKIVAGWELLARLLHGIVQPVFVGILFYLIFT